MQLRVDTDEARVLRAVLERYLGDLRAEIYKTENADMRTDLKSDEATIKTLLGRLTAI